MNAAARRVLTRGRGCFLLFLMLLSTNHARTRGILLTRTYSPHTNVLTHSFKSINIKIILSYHILLLLLRLLLLPIGTYTIIKGLLLVIHLRLLLLFKIHV